MKKFWLTAYLDGELSPARRRQVERELQRDASLRQELEQLRWIARQLKNLPSRELPQPVDHECKRHIEATPHPHVPLADQEIQTLLVAYAYDELDATGREQVEKQFLHHEEHRQALDELRKMRQAIGALPRQEIPPATLKELLGRLHQIPAAARPGKSWKAQLSAYVDGEVSARRRAKIEAGLADSDKARAYLADLNKLTGILRELPKLPAPAGLMNRAIDELKEETFTVSEPAATSWSTRVAEPQRSLLPAFAIACSVCIVAGLGLALSNLTVGDPSPSTVQKPPVVAQSKPVPAAPSGIDELHHLLTSSEKSLAERLDRRQLTVSAVDAEQLFDAIALKDQPLSIEESSINGRRVVKLEGEPGRVGHVLRRLEETSRQGDLVQSVKITFVSDDVLARMNQVRIEEIPRRPQPKASVDIVGAVRRGLNWVNDRIDSDQKEVARAEVPSTDKKTSARAVSPRPAPLNQPAVAAKPVRVFLVLERTKP